MPSPDPIPTTLSDHLRQLGLGHTAAELNDLIARATQKRWSPVVLLEQLAQAELAARLHHRVERRLHEARLGRFKSLADFEWTWPTHLHRPTVERVFTLDFLAQRENVPRVAGDPTPRETGPVLERPTIGVPPGVRASWDTPGGCWCLPPPGVRPATSPQELNEPILGSFVVKRHRCVISTSSFPF
jgi:hypothetical protein